MLKAASDKALEIYNSNSEQNYHSLIDLAKLYTLNERERKIYHYKSKLKEFITQD